ncbi:hypothetical protein ATANTOWER_029224 [Ataeniobius toweri]|uniref:Uncharacterized protein n=1 Tax=Ataeniobius toweri TaxID=208326 RepID=A0ABU7BV45_9TELE|nr:hypothetical protein [Ataeniobius toweri]
MFSYSSASFSDNGTCNKCSIFVALEARVSELEAEPPRVAPRSSPPAEPTQPGPQAGGVTIFPAQRHTR